MARHCNPQESRKMPSVLIILLLLLSPPYRYLAPSRIQYAVAASSRYGDDYGSWGNKDGGNEQRAPNRSLQQTQPAAAASSPSMLTQCPTMKGSLLGANFSAERCCLRGMESLNGQQGICSKPCLRGQTMTSGSDTCTSCPIGTTSNGFTGSCMECPRGTSTAPADGIYECTPCPRGTLDLASYSADSMDMTGAAYKTTSKPVPCVACPAGFTSQKAAGVQQCSACMEGFISKVEVDKAIFGGGDFYTAVKLSRSVCQPCGEGSYADSETNTCKACPPGTYSNNRIGIFTDFCTPCPAGTIATKPNSTACTPPCPCGFKWTDGCGQLAKTAAELKGVYMSYMRTRQKLPMGNAIMCVMQMVLEDPRQSSTLKELIESIDTPVDGNNTTEEDSWQPDPSVKELATLMANIQSGSLPVIPSATLIDMDAINGVLNFMLGTKFQFTQMRDLRDDLMVTINNGFKAVEKDMEIGFNTIRNIAMDSFLQSQASLFESVKREVQDLESICKALEKRIKLLYDESDNLSTKAENAENLISRTYDAFTKAMIVQTAFDIVQIILDFFAFAMKMSYPIRFQLKGRLRKASKRFNLGGEQDAPDIEAVSETKIKAVSTLHNDEFSDFGPTRPRSSTFVEGDTRPRSSSFVAPETRPRSSTFEAPETRSRSSAFSGPPPAPVPPQLQRLNSITESVDLDALHESREAAYLKVDLLTRRRVKSQARLRIPTEIEEVEFRGASSSLEAIDVSELQLDSEVDDEAMDMVKKYLIDAENITASAISYKLEADDRGLQIDTNFTAICTQGGMWVEGACEDYRSALKIGNSISQALSTIDISIAEATAEWAKYKLQIFGKIKSQSDYSRSISVFNHVRNRSVDISNYDELFQSTLALAIQHNLTKATDELNTAINTTRYILAKCALMRFTYPSLYYDPLCKINPLNLRRQSISLAIIDIQRQETLASKASGSQDAIVKSGYLPLVGVDGAVPGLPINVSNFKATRLAAFTLDQKQVAHYLKDARGAWSRVAMSNSRIRMQSLRVLFRGATVSPDCEEGVTVRVTLSPPFKLRYLTDTVDDIYEYNFPFVQGDYSFLPSAMCSGGRVLPPLPGSTEAFCDVSPLSWSGTVIPSPFAMWTISLEDDKCLDLSTLDEIFVSMSLAVDRRYETPINPPFIREGGVNSSALPTPLELTWQEYSNSCKNANKTLCTANEICPHKAQKLQDFFKGPDGQMNATYIAVTNVANAGNLWVPIKNGSDFCVPRILTDYSPELIGARRGNVCC